jgi:8-amino-7-oxononanoate synthase
MTKPFNALRMADTQISELDLQLLKRKLRINHSACDTKSNVDQRELKTFCSNDYLGLANHPALIEALVEGVKRYGAGSGASHLISGHSIAHELLEKKLASYQSEHIPRARALFFSTGYLANIAAITGPNKARTVRSSKHLFSKTESCILNRWCSFSQRTEQSIGNAV